MLANTSYSAVFRKDLGQDRLLGVARQVKLVLQCCQLVARRERLAPLLKVTERSLDGHLQVFEIDWLGDKVKGPPVHRRADVLHVAVRGCDYAPDVVAGDVRYLFEQGQAVHLRHVDVRDDQVYVIVFGQHLKASTPVWAKEEAVRSRPDLATHAQLYQRLEVRLVVHHEDSGTVLPLSPPSVWSMCASRHLGPWAQSSRRVSQRRTYRALAGTAGTSHTPDGTCPPGIACPYSSAISTKGIDGGQAGYADFGVRARTDCFSSGTNGVEVMGRTGGRAKGPDPCSRNPPDATKRPARKDAPGASVQSCMSSIAV